MKPPRTTENELILGLVSVSDRASRGVYEDKGIPALEAWCQRAIKTPVRIHKRLIPDERFDIERTLRELVDIIGCDLILTTGGTGPARRDVTPEATLAVATREMPGFGEQMRAISGHFVPTAILSRQVGVLRETPDHAALILNLPGQPKAIAETLEGLRDDSGKTVVNGIFAAVPYCIDLIGGPYIETDPEVVKAFRPKSARRPEAKQAGEPAAAPEAAAKPAEPAQAPEPVKAAEEPAPVKPVPEAVKEEPKPAKPAFDAKDILVVRPRTGGEPELVGIWLHGMGVDNKDFATFPDEIVHFDGPSCRFVLPNAPIREMALHPGYPLRAWYDLPGRSIDDNEDAINIRDSARRVTQLIDEIEAQGVPRNRIVLGGFSQGAAISLFAGLRMERPIGGIVALSGYLPLAGHLYSEVTTAGRQTPVFMGHGEFDSVVPLVTARRSAEVIAQVDSDLVARTYPMEHELCPDEMHDLAAFLTAVLERAQG
ncbi:molybdopterin adenylyltransferase [Sutterella sp.]|uniref:molybdopterin adenylyltransferase n=1 Tax=Sutterella sp. TaxID=1981025 RepID=UPI0026DFEF95|nr:molybdopterin adenylyltransferase [Sutterella sp.]MDO5531749.1 molybdopterin adenylyltransferase [Sutterella sp.]